MKLSAIICWHKMGDVILAWESSNSPINTHPHNHTTTHTHAHMHTYTHCMHYSAFPT